MDALVPKWTRRIARLPGLRQIIHLLREPRSAPQQTDQEKNCAYWTNYNVADHRRFASPKESLEFFHWRNHQYHNYIDLMPVDGQDGRVVLDYGCGPGNDLVGFAEFSTPSRLIGMDVSPSSLAEAKARVALHGRNAEFFQIVENENQLPLESRSVDHVHSSGVVHHTVDPVKVLKEFRRVLKPTGTCRIMVYNYDCIWLHLFVGYVKLIKENAFPGLSLRAAFGKMTDTIECPISRVYKPAEFIDLAKQSGLHCRFLGAAIAMAELVMLPQRFEALRCPTLPSEHREFLQALQFDGNGIPLYNGSFAGIDGCYELTQMT